MTIITVLKVACASNCVIVVTLCLMVGACGKQSESRGDKEVRQMLNGSVSFSVPLDWVFYKQHNKEAAEIIQFALPDTETPNSPRSGSALFTAEPVRAGASVTSWVDWWLSRRAEQNGYVVA